MSYTTEWVIAEQEAEDQGRVFDFDAYIKERNAKEQKQRSGSILDRTETYEKL